MNSLCDSLQGCDALALDTEFIRTNTFYPRTGLVQLHSGTSCHLVDPQGIDDWSGLVALLQASDHEFVMHSAGEDLVLLLTQIGALPQRLYDTQLAAAFAGLGFSTGYQGLVAELLDVQLEKESTRSDWLRRPLSEKQLQYAQADVAYLFELRELLNTELESRDRSEWFREDCAWQLELARQLEDPQQWRLAYLAINNAWKLQQAGLCYLRCLAEWREQEARQRDKPRNWLATDQDLFNLALAQQQQDNVSLQSIYDSRHVDRRLLRRYGEAFAELLLQAPQDDEPLQPPPRPLQPAMRGKLKKLQGIVKEVAERLDLPPELLGRKRRLIEMLDGYMQHDRLQWPGEMSGWRRRVLEEGFVAEL